MNGARIGFSSGDIKLLTDDLQALKPTVFPTVPRLLNRMYDKVSTCIDNAVTFYQISQIYTNVVFEITDFRYVDRTILLYYNLLIFSLGNSRGKNKQVEILSLSLCNEVKGKRFKEVSRFFSFMCLTIFMITQDEIFFCVIFLTILDPKIKNMMKA